MRSRRSRLATVAILGILALGALPASVFAAADLKLTLLPVGQAGAWFDLTMKPGDTRVLHVDIANDGGAHVAARTYAADVYTIINGGFGGRLRAEPATGTTRWLDYPTKIYSLDVGERTRRSFSVTVPVDTGPGEYITSLILENDQPTLQAGGIGLEQIVRQAVAVVVTVPGRRAPAVSIGDASLTVAAGRSAVDVAVANDGNVRVKPVVRFTLIDPAGIPGTAVSSRMDSFYSHTSTLVEIPLERALAPGLYTVRLTLVDPDTDLAMETAERPLLVEAPVEPAAGPGTGTVPALAELIGGGTAATVALAVGSLLLLAIAILILRLRRQRRATAANALSPRPAVMRGPE